MTDQAEAAGVYPASDAFIANAHATPEIYAKMYAESISDYVSRELFVKILDSEEEHIDWLETQLDLIERIGEPNYLLTKLED